MTPASFDIRSWFIAAIDATPMFELAKLEAFSQSRVFAQAELFSPTGSHKDRMYLHIIQTLERADRIRPGMTLVDYSSGNGGAALAFVARLFGYEAVIVRPAGLSFGKAAQITSFGAYLVESPEKLGVEGAIQGAREVARALGPDRCFFIDQGEQDYNADAFEPLGRRMAAQLRERDIYPELFVCTIGTGGTFTGVAKELKREFSGVRCVAVDIEGQTMLSHTYGGHALSSDGHSIEGVSVGKVFRQCNDDLIDDFIVVKPEEAVEACRQLWLSTQLFAGMSSGANLAGIAKLRPKTAVTMLWDAAWKYLDDKSFFHRVTRDRRTSLQLMLDVSAKFGGTVRKG